MRTPLHNFFKTCTATTVALLMVTSGCVTEEPDAGNGDTEVDIEDCVGNEFPSTIDEDTTIGPECHYVDSFVDVDNGTLTIAPGTTLVFAENRGINVHRDGDGRLHAEGTEDDPIVFTGEEELDGFWQGIRYRSSVSQDNVLDNVVIEYAGSSEMRFADHTTGLLIDRSRVELRDVTIRNSGDYGLLSLHSDSQIIMDGGTFTENGAPIRVANPTTVGAIDPNADLTGNDDDKIFVGNGTIVDDVVWEQFEIPLYARNITNEDHTMEIAAGNVVEFRQGGRINTIEDGRLNATGTADAPIILQGEEPTTGYWNGIRYYDTTGADNALKFVEIRDGGGSDLRFADHAANLTIGRSLLSAEELTLTNSGEYGVVISSPENTLDFDCSTITNDDGWIDENGDTPPC